MSADLCPCPFCGSEADMQNDFGVDYWVQCKNLECGAVEGSIHSSPAPALARWNRRAPQPPAVKEADSVPVPANADQAAMIVQLGTLYLELHAPERLKKVVS